METVHYKNEYRDFEYVRRYDENLNVSDFMLHNHNHCSEILFFIRGNSEFRVEGSTYKMNPYDIVVAGSAEMHKMWHNEVFLPYERVVISINDRFFFDNDYKALKNVFIRRQLGENNLFDAESVERSGLKLALCELEEYIKTDDELTDIAIRSKLVDILCKLNRLSEKSNDSAGYSNDMKDILSYINDNITTPMTLDEIANHFYISKYYLCHKFKKHTGLTIGQYINRKKLLIAREMFESGKSLMHSCMEAGFGSYSGFYKMYVKEFADSPKYSVKKKNVEIL